LAREESETHLSLRQQSLCLVLLSIHNSTLLFLSSLLLNLDSLLELLGFLSGTLLLLRKTNEKREIDGQFDEREDAGEEKKREGDNEPSPEQPPPQ